MNKNGRTIPRRKILAGMAAGGAVALAGIRAPRAQAKPKVIFIEPADYALEFIKEINGVVGGHFEKQGIDVEIITARGTSIALQQVVAGQAHVVRVGGLDLMRGNSVQPVPIVSAATSLHEGIFSMVSLKSAPITKPADLKGKVVGVGSLGGGQENVLNLMLTDAGIPIAEVPRQAIGVSAGSIELLKKGRIAAYYVTVEAGLALRRANEPVEIWNTAKLAPVPGGAIVFRRDYTEQNQETMVKFARGLYASAVELLSADPAMILDRVEKKYDLAVDKSRDFRIQALKAYNEMSLAQGRPNLLRNVPEVWRKAAGLASAAGLVKVANADALYTNKFIDQARA